MENILLISVLAILLIYFFSTMSVYKSLYQKVNEEKNILEADHSKYQTLLNDYQKQVESHSGAIEKVQKALNKARSDLQETKSENISFKHKVDVLERRTEDLYAQVNTMV